MIGASLLWVGWFGFNAGSAVTAGTNAGMAMAVTQIATATAALTWMFVEWGLKGKPSVLGICSGAVAGLVAITPASGFVDPRGALIIGVAAGVVLLLGRDRAEARAWAMTTASTRSACMAVGGTVGALLTGVLAVAAVGGDGKSGLIDGNPQQVITQLYGVGCTIVYDAIVSLILLKIIDLVIGLRVDIDSRARGSRPQSSRRGRAVAKAAGSQQSRHGVTPWRLLASDGDRPMSIFASYLCNWI